ncbi:MAG: hypothetical protein ACUVWP_08220 [bacterium]
MIFAGIDAGSRAIKIIIWDNNKQVVIAQTVADQNLDKKNLAQDIFNQLIEEKKI